MTVLSICDGRYRFDTGIELDSGTFGTVYGDREGKIAVKVANYQNALRSLASIQHMVSGSQTVYSQNIGDEYLLNELQNLRLIKHQNIVEMLDYDKVRHIFCSEKSAVYKT